MLDSLLLRLQDLPWRRVTCWSLAALAAYQMKDFFGVRHC